MGGVTVREGEAEANRMRRGGGGGTFRGDWTFVSLSFFAAAATAAATAAAAAVRLQFTVFLGRKTLRALNPRFMQQTTWELERDIFSSRYKGRTFCSAAQCVQCLCRMRGGSSVRETRR